MDQEEANRRIAEQEYEAARADAAERIRQQLVIADAAMKALLWANGGALVALFTFIGNASANRMHLDVGQLWTAFAFFVGGLVLALLTHAFAFLSQDRYYLTSMHEAWRAQRNIMSAGAETPGAAELDAFGKGKAFYSLAFALALISIALFATGCGFALAGVLIG